MNQDLEAARSLSLAWVQEASNQDASYTAVFNGLAMFAVAMLIPYMQDQDIPLTKENIRSEMDRIQQNIYSATEFFSGHILNKEKED